MQIAAPRATLTTGAIMAMLDAAVARAREREAEVHIAVYDASARVVGFISMDGALPIAAVTAHRKANTSAITGLSTAQWEAYVNSLPPGELKIIDTLEGYIAAKGGYPVRQDGLLLGAIGVSGANQELDADIAEAALKAIGVTA